MIEYQDVWHSACDPAGAMSGQGDFHFPTTEKIYVNHIILRRVYTVG